MSVSQQGTGDGGVVFGPYRVHQRIGVGGMATVHRAKELGIEGFERWVALKRLLPHLAEDETFVRSFVREAKLASLLAHPNIVQIYELGRVGGVYFISMELIEGYDVRQILRQARRVTGPPPIAVTLAILTQICDALEYAHSRTDDTGQPLGLVHRDVSPSNVIVSDSGHLKIIDFGIAKAQTQQLATNTGRVKGKMAYMSPEAIRGLHIDGRSDLFSLGVLAHELLTARPLFASKNDYKTLQRVQSATVAPPSTYNRDCPPELDAVILRALDRDRDERWQTAGEMQNELVQIRQQYRFSAQPRDITDWMTWAFTVEAPTPSRKLARVDTPQPHSQQPAVVFEQDPLFPMLTPQTAPPQIPVGNVALPTAEEDDEIIEIAWGGRSRSQAILLDDVPDVSGRVLATSGATPTPAPTTPTPGLSTTPAPKPDSTLIAPAPPPPDKRPRKPTAPRLWATGTKPPIVELPSPAGASDELRLDRFPLAVSEDDEEITGVEDLPSSIPRPRRSTTSGAALVRFRSTGPVPIPRPPVDTGPTAVTPTSGLRSYSTQRHLTPTARRVAGATSIGASIVERERRRRFATVLLALGVVAAAAVATYLLTRDRSSAVAAGAAAAPASSQVRLLVEPADAVIDIDGTIINTRPAITRLAAGEHTLTVERDGYKPWTATLDVSANENQMLRVVLAPDTSEQPSALVESVEAPASAPPPRSRVERVASSPAPVPELAAPAQALAGDDDDRVDAAVRYAPRNLPVASPPPPAPQKASQTPPVVPPTAVKKRAGSVPKLRADHDTLPGRVSAELCIDRRGKVSSVRLLSRITGPAANELTDALRKWRYAPYRRNGQRLAVCFAVNFRTR